MLLLRRDANEEEIEQVQELFRAQMGGDDKTALVLLIFGVLCVLYSLNYGQAFIGWSSVPVFLFSYAAFNRNVPLEQKRRKLSRGFEVIEYEGLITQQVYGCCGNQRVSLYIDEYELISFSPSKITSLEMAKWRHIKPHKHYSVTVAFIEGVNPQIFSLTEINPNATERKYP